MARTKKGDVFSCDVCGLIVSVDQACGCVEEGIICCDVPMEKGKAAANRVRKEAAAAGKRVPVKKAAVKKPAAKKTARKAAPRKAAQAKKTGMKRKQA